ncbi:LVIVD repeat-containing protein [Hymenobacter sp. B1770]|uniref:LVIVD repeat-containing protein n=1 Tax=Hymenobacter sp. B1770 TaxID=1718788 RepID=UPI003CF557DA
MKNLFLLRLSTLLSLVVTLSSNSCGSSSDASFNSAGGDGQAGSMARFAIMGNTLYAVDHFNLRTFDLSTPRTPAAGPVVPVGTDIETIFPRAPYLFIGSQRGMFIYDTNSSTPRLVGSYEHAVSCDPVVVADRYAYVTLRNDGGCARGVNQLDVVDLVTMSRPLLVKSYPMSQPYGLGVDSSLVFVCDRGIKVFDARNTPNLVQLQAFNIAATDVIARRGVLLVTGADGLYQYRYSAPTATGAGSLQQLSRIPVVPLKK